MDGTLIDIVRYMDGHSELGNTPWMVKLIAYPTTLTIVTCGR